MSNHIYGNWFVSVFEMERIKSPELERIAENRGHRETTRRNAKLRLEHRKRVIANMARIARFEL